ncbi:MAG: arginine deiminase family protein [bacterium]
MHTWRWLICQTSGQPISLPDRELKKWISLNTWEAKGVEIINVSDSEQQRLACTFVPLHCRAIIHYDTALDMKTQKLLTKRGIEIITLHPEALTAGGGSLRCLTLRLHRECQCSQISAI